MEFLRDEWELSHKEPSLKIHRDAFIEEFGDINFEIINRFLRDLDERYHAIRVNDYAYSEKWDEGKYLDLSAEEIAAAQNTKPTKKNIDALNQTILTTSLVIEPDFLNVLEAFIKPWERVQSEQSPVEGLVVAKLRLSGKRLLLEVEGKQAEIWSFKSYKGKGYNVCKSLLDAKGRLLPKHGLTTSVLKTNITQLPKLIHLEPKLAKIFYHYEGNRAALSYKLELNKHDAMVVRNYVKRKIREKREA